MHCVPTRQVVLSANVLLVTMEMDSSAQVSKHQLLRYSNIEDDDNDLPKRFVGSIDSFFTIFFSKQC